MSNLHFTPSPNNPITHPTSHPAFHPTIPINNPHNNSPNLLSNLLPVLSPNIGMCQKPKCVNISYFSNVVRFRAGTLKKFSLSISPSFNLSLSISPSFNLSSNLSPYLSPKSHTLPKTINQPLLPCHLSSHPTFIPFQPFLNLSLTLTPPDPIDPF